MEDRRQHQRYRLEESCILNYSSSVGTIIDICMGGLSCMCLENNKCEQKSADREVDIFCKENKLFAQGLPITVLGTSVVPGEYVIDVKIRKCRAKYENLEEDQKVQVEEIILSHGVN